MTKEVGLFGDMPAAFTDMLAQLEPETNLMGNAGGSGGRKLSIRGAVFRKVVGGEEVGTIDSRTMNIVVVKSAPISRMYYEGTYSEGESSAPTCWSSNTSHGKPSEDVRPSEAPALSCSSCPQNIKGSGTGESRACRYQQRIAVLLADADGNVVSPDTYLLSLPATSVFGDNKQKMSMQAYARHLNAHKAPLASVITELRFDTEVTHPRLCFKPQRVLTQEELALAITAQQDPETAKLVELKITPKEAKELQATSLPAPKEEVVAGGLFADDEAPIEPKKKAKKKAAKVEPVGSLDLSSLLDDFDD
tara:strand:+ start:1567 stop:2484 length:918 start_codon:yes stop_codon:yes gene_type:complete